MTTPDDKIDFAKAKLTFDKIYDSTTDIAGRLKDIDGMAQTIRTMAGTSAPSRLRLIMLRKYIYEAGAWNNNKPFQYDLSDPFGHKPVNRLLSTYLVTHRGNCVSMPILFVALAQRLGLNATLSTAPNHMFVKYMDDVTGKTINLETTSGAYPARDVYIRQNMPMTDQAIGSVKRDPQTTRNPAIRASIEGSAAEAAFCHRGTGGVRVARLDTGGRRGRSLLVRRQTADVFAHLASLNDGDGMRVAAFFMARSLQSGSDVVEEVGTRLAVDARATWQPDDAFFDLIRDRAKVTGWLPSWLEFSGAGRWAESACRSRTGW